MAQIKIEITIPDHEYESWNDYQDGLEEVLANVKKDISKRLKQDHIRHFDVEVTHKEN